MIRILHLHSTFAPGGKEARAVRLMNAFGSAARHTVVSAVPDQLGARAAIAPGIDVNFPPDAPLLQGRPGMARYRALARYMAGFDLVLTYNWGAMDAVMARRLWAPLMAVPPLVHHEDGFNADETMRQKPERMLFRRLALPAASTLVVPSQRLETIAHRTWRQPAHRVRRISNGIRIDDGDAPFEALAFPGLSRAPGEVVIGTVAGLRAVKDLPRLVRWLAKLPPHVRLVIVGDGPERATIAAEVKRYALESRVLLVGFHPDPKALLGHFDLFALSSRSEQFPIAVLEAMAAGLPVVSPAVGDVAVMVAPPNRPFILDDDAGLIRALATFAAEPDLRKSVGAANRRRAVADFGEAAMIAAYRSLYAGVIGQAGALG